MFFDEIGLQPDEAGRIPNKELYHEYQQWCLGSGYKHLSIRNFTKMLKQHQYDVVRHGFGMMIYATRNNHTPSHEYETYSSKVTPF
jgi:phage/plasmid-associated DNA primase